MCLEIQLKVEFEEDDLYMLDTRNVLAVNFNNTIVSTRENCYVYFMYREEGKDFSESFQLIVNATINQITFEQLEIKIEDKFELLKNPSSIFKSETNIMSPTRYLENVKRKFLKMTNKTSKKLFIADKYGEFDLEIDEEELFEQFFVQFQEKLDESGFTSMNSVKTVYNAYNQYKITNDFRSGFLFAISKSKRITVITNTIDTTKLIINILNTMSLWLDLSILDFSTYIRNLIFHIHNFCILLVRLRIYLRKKIIRTFILVL